MKPFGTCARDSIGSHKYWSPKAPKDIPRSDTRVARIGKETAGRCNMIRL